jgi:hypothetical protein
MLRRLVLAVAVVALLSACAAAAAMQVRWSGGLGSYGNVVGMPVRIRASFSVGMAQLKAERRVQIESVRLDHPTPGLVLVGALVYPLRRGMVGSDGRFPPTYPRVRMRAADGVVLPTHTAVGLVVGIRPTALGAFRVHGLEVLYRERWHGIDVRRRAHVGVEINGCAVRASTRIPRSTLPRPIE